MRLPTVPKIFDFRVSSCKTPALDLHSALVFTRNPKLPGGNICENLTIRSLEVVICVFRLAAG